MAFVITTPQVVSQQYNDIVPENVNILPNNIKIVDLIKYTNRAAIKWNYSLFNPNNENFFGAEVYCVYKSSSNKHHVWYNHIGDRINHSIEIIDISSTNFGLQITNNTPDTLTLSLLRYNVSLI